MASASGDDDEGRRDPNETWNFKFNPFNTLGIFSEEEVTPDNIKKVYHALIRTIHFDKSGIHGLGTKLTTCYNFFKGKDEAALKALFRRFSGQTDGTCGNDSFMRNKASNILMDRTKSEHYRRLFKEALLLAQKNKLNDNFKKFYKQVFDHVETQPEVKAGYTCAICEEEFICEDDHVQLIFEPYTEYILEGGQPGGILKYLQGIFGAEVLNWEPPIFTTGDWTGHKIQASFNSWCALLQPLKFGGIEDELKKLKRAVRNDKVDSLLSVLEGHTAMTGFFSTKNLINEALGKTSAMVPASPLRINENEMLLPAFFKIFLEDNEWSQFHLELINKSPRFCLILGVILRHLHPESEDDGYFHLGKKLLESGKMEALQYAHLAFVLGSCDLKFVAETLMSSCESVNGKHLAAQYLLRSGQLEKMEKLGEQLAEENKRDKALIFLFPLIKQHLVRNDYEEVIRLLRIWLPPNKLWNCIQSMVTENPQLALDSEQVARVTLTKIIIALSTPAEVLNMMKPDSETGITPLTTAVSAIPGALHVFQDMTEDKKNAVYECFSSVLGKALYTNDIGAVTAFTRIPDILPVVQKILEVTQFWGTNLVTTQVGNDFHNRLLLLRGAFQYKRYRVSEMLEDFTRAALNTGKREITKAIGKFLASNPLIHEKIVRLMTTQFSRLSDYIDKYDWGPIPPTLDQVLQNENPTLEENGLSSVFRLTSSGKGSHLQDAIFLEKEILGRKDNPFKFEEEEDDDDESQVEKEKDTPTTLAEKGFSYVDLEVICLSIDTTISSLTMGAHYFLQAMVASPDSCIPEKYAYLRLVNECMENSLKGYWNLFMVSPQVALYALRSSLSLTFRANQHMSQALRKHQREFKLAETLRFGVNFIEDGKVGDVTARWQNALNWRMLCPIFNPEIFPVGDGAVALLSMRFLFQATLTEKVKAGIFSKNAPEYLYNQILFNEVWCERVNPEDTGYEGGKHLPEVESVPLVERIGFRMSRNEAMQHLAEFNRFDMKQVEHMMSWHLIRRTRQGFIDTKNRSLDFTGEQMVFSRFLGVQVNPTKGTHQLLLERAVPGDAQKPALFSALDIMEIFGNQIEDAFLTFDEQVYCDEKLTKDYAKVLLPFHPFFKVRFGALAADGKVSKERICGTNFLMTLYHLDLLAKMFTTGQEIGAKFPFPIRDTTTHLLGNLSAELRQILKPIGHMKKAENLRQLEHTHRFWFNIEDVEQEIQQPGDGSIYFRYGETNLALKTMPMQRGEDGSLADAQNLFSEDSPESQFVAGFNSKLDQIEKYFPIIRRTKELAKISACLAILQRNKDTLAKNNRGFNDLINFKKMPKLRPYSMCTWNSSTPCACCDWVPAVFHKSEVTDEQKLEYLFKKKFSSHNNAVKGEVPVAQLPGPEGKKGPFPAGAKNKSDPKDKKSDDPSVNMAEYDLLEKYRVYGGVRFTPSIRAVSGLGRVQGFASWSAVVNSNTGHGYLARGAPPPPPPPPPPPSSGGARCMHGRNADHNTTNRQRLNYCGPTWIYYIRDTGGQGWAKVGISSVPPNQNGTLERAARQVSRLNNNGDGRQYEYRVYKQFPTRMEARVLESKYTNMKKGQNVNNLPMERGKHPY